MVALADCTPLSASNTMRDSMPTVEDARGTRQRSRTEREHAPVIRTAARFGGKGAHHGQIFWRRSLGLDSIGTIERHHVRGTQLDDRVHQREMRGRRVGSGLVARRLIEHPSREADEPACREHRREIVHRRCYVEPAVSRPTI